MSRRHHSAEDSLASEIGRGRRSVAISSSLRDRTPAPQGTPLEDAEVVWGKSADFSWGTSAQNLRSDPLVNGSITWGGVTWPPDPESPGDQTLPPLVQYWDEVSRVERTVRIEGENGSWIEVQRLDTVTWRCPPLSGGQQVFVVQRYKAFSDG